MAVPALAALATAIPSLGAYWALKKTGGLPTMTKVDGRYLNSEEKEKYEKGLVETRKNMSQVDKLYEAFQNAETGHLEGDDKFIRTEANLTKGGSSAYGPTQMTGTLVRDMLDRGVIPDHLKDYANRFLDQSDLFLKYGNEKGLKGYAPKYDYGGSGHLTSPEDQENYKDLSKVLIAHHWNNAQETASGYDERKPLSFAAAAAGTDPINTIIRDWRFGPDSKKGRAHDSRYWRRFKENFYKK